MAAPVHQQGGGQARIGYMGSPVVQEVCGSGWLAPVSFDASRRSPRAANWIFQASRTHLPSIGWSVSHCKQLNPQSL
jgi:hypothetical protein